MKTLRFLLALTLATQVPAQAQLKSKTEIEIKTETLKRTRGTILRKVEPRRLPQVPWAEESFEKARQVSFDRKTIELIRQLEDLRKRPGQKNRLGELEMRLAELYFDLARSTGNQEGQVWEKQIQNWESLAEKDRLTVTRPQLKTPKADNLRKKTLKLYESLEKRSRVSDLGRSQMIRREEVLYFLAATLIDLGNRKGAKKYLEEIVARFTTGERVFAAQANLADIYFETREFAKAIPLYQKVASGNAVRSQSASENIQNYARYRLAWSFINTGQPEKAIESFKQVLEISKSKNASDRKLVFEGEVLMDLAFTFALAGQLDEGENFLSNQEGDTGKIALQSFWRQAVVTAEEKLDFKRADDLYNKLIKLNPESEEARSLAWSQVQLGVKKKDFNDFALRLEYFAKNFGGDSPWMAAQKSADQINWKTEMVSTLRREAKNQHRLAQTKKDDEEYLKARRLYDIYFSFVPGSLADSSENLNEMYFYSGELAFRLKDFSRAEKDYAKLTADSKLAREAGYGRILALQKMGSQGAQSKEFVRAAEAFSVQFPSDERSAGILYLSAEEAFKSGESEDSLATLQKVVDRFSNQKIGVEAAERVLFVLEKQGSFDRVQSQSDLFLKNKNLVKAGGPEFAQKLEGLKDLASFKKIEALPEASVDELRAKADAFAAYARSQKGYTSERAYNNAWVFGQKALSAVELRSLADEFLTKFPRSQFIKTVLLRRAEVGIAEADYEGALKLYKNYHQSFGKKEKPSQEGESALWNLIFIEAHLEDVFQGKALGGKNPSDELVGFLEDLFAIYPGSRHQTQALEIFGLRPTAKKTEVQRILKKIIPNSETRKLAQEIEKILDLRITTANPNLLSKFPADSNKEPRVAEILAKLTFQGLEKEFESLQNFKLDYRMAGFAKSLSSKLDKLEKLEGQYLNVVSYGYAPTALLSLERLSRSFSGLASDIFKAPAKKEELSQFANPLIEKSKGFIKKCLDKAQELKVGGSILKGCRDLATQFNVGGDILIDEKIPSLGWLPALDPKTLIRPHLRATVEFTRKSQWSRARLALEIGRGDFAQLSENEKAVMYFFEGLNDYQAGNSELAAKNFRLALANPGTPTVAKTSRKNLAALYLEVGDYAQALDLMKETGDGKTFGDSDEALLLGLAARGEGELDLALEAYEAGIAGSRTNKVLLYNFALSLAATNSFREALKYMGQYVELERPSPKDSSRRWLSQWKEKSRDGIPEDTL